MQTLNRFFLCGKRIHICFVEEFEVPQAVCVAFVPGQGRILRRAPRDLDRRVTGSNNSEMGASRVLKNRANAYFYMMWGALLDTTSVRVAAWVSPDIVGMRDAAYDLGVTTDKVTGAADPLGHEYHIMYGLFLIPVLKNAGRATKMLEIGLGCAMNYGPGASALLWRKLLPNTELWEADIDERCIMKHQISMLQQGIHTLVGNQKDPAVLQRWIEMSRGDFDAIIDDGSHLNADIMNTFNALWPHLNPGGTYFMEDLQVGRAIPYENTKGERVPSDVLQAWLEQLVLPDLLTPKGLNNKPRASLGQRAYLSAWRSGNRTLANRNAREARERHPVPADVAFVFCQTESCAIGKKLRIPEFALPGATMPPSERAARHANQNPFYRRSPRARPRLGNLTGGPGNPRHPGHGRFAANATAADALPPEQSR